MVEKDTAALDRVHANEFVLVHMTGMRQTKKENINLLNQYEMKVKSIIMAALALLMATGCNGQSKQEVKQSKRYQYAKL